MVLDPEFSINITRLKHIFINQNRNVIIINILLPTRNTFIPAAKKISASGFNQLLESIFCILLVVEAFSLQKSCQDAQRSGSQLAVKRSGEYSIDEAKFSSPVCSTFEALVVHHVTGHRHREELGPFC